MDKKLFFITAWTAFINTIGFMFLVRFWPASRDSFFKDWIPWISIVANLSALVALMYCWIQLKSLKKEAVKNLALIEKLSEDLILLKSAPGGHSADPKPGRIK
jgi:uncharacterized membrane protein YedE/YeeE